MTDEPTFVLPFHDVEDFPPESAPLAVKSAQATSNGLIDPVMFGPNITGTFTEHGNTSGLKCTGAFTGEARIGLNSNQGGASDGGRVTMNSSLSSSVYGAASTVQPASTRLLYCIKS